MRGPAEDQGNGMVGCFSGKRVGVWNFSPKLPFSLERAVPSKGRHLRNTEQSTILSGMMTQRGSRA